MSQFIIKGVHPESDSEWVEPESFDTIEKAFEYVDAIPYYDGCAFYEVWDSHNNVEINRPLNEYKETNLPPKEET